MVFNSERLILHNSLLMLGSNLERNREKRNLGNGLATVNFLIDGRVRLNEVCAWVNTLEFELELSKAENIIHCEVVLHLLDRVITL